MNVIASARPSYEDEARAAWGDAPPVWVKALASAADRDGVKAVAAAIRYSNTTVFEIIRRQYKGSLSNVETAIRAALMRDAVACPVLGEITGPDCLRHQDPGRRPVNSTEVALARKCPRCMYRKGQ